MKQLLLRLLINAVAIYVTVLIVPGIRFGDGGVDVGALLVVAIIFGIVNAVIKPIVALFTCPFYVLTLGLFTFIVNALMLLLTDWIAGNVGVSEFQVDGFWPALIGGIIIAVVSTLLSIFVSEDDDSRAR
jgi:putative membrane protein